MKKQNIQLKYMELSIQLVREKLNVFILYLHFVLKSVSTDSKYSLSKKNFLQIFYRIVFLLIFIYFNKIFRGAGEGGISPKSY